jgi:formylglycine-generating enzyme required for sulfatase activity
MGGGSRDLYNGIRALAGKFIAGMDSSGGVVVQKASQTGTLAVTVATAGTLTVTGTGVNQSANLSAGGSWNKSDLVVGTYSLTMRYTDGRNESKEVSITNGQTTITGFTYTPPLTGTLVVTTVTGGSLTVTGSGVNQSATLTANENWNKADLAAGNYTVTVRYADGKSESKTVSITGGQTVVTGFTYIPPPPSGAVNVTAVTAGTITVSGTGVNQSASVSAGGSWNKSDLAPGSYTVTVRYFDGKTETQTVTVTSGRTVAASFTYRPAPPAPANMVWVAAGTFTMRSPSSEVSRQSREGPQHQVTISKGFYLGKYEVTQKEWVAVMGSNPSNWKGDNLPVENVSWFDVIDYCNALSRREGLTPAYAISGINVTWNKGANGYRLPTEAEWEYACRAGTTSPFSTGSNITTSQANYNGNYPYNNNAKGIYREKTTAVGSFAANYWGLYDMHGNVYEWCWDWYGDYASGSQTDPSGAASGANRVSRGGSWDYYAEYVRSASRDGSTPSFRSLNLGFRLVRP